ncbi:MAG: ATP-dependent Clp protease proteolytic subunit [Myxococcota bacterium]|jgi:ATP-dependent Clp protease protease subunit|nr:ATP-dependent Clp protease proteolytic subunit [Myxococcota bacterium]
MGCSTHDLCNLGILKEQEEFLAKKRRLFLWGAVQDESAEDLVKKLMWLDSQSAEDIYLFINSPGGVISSGMALYDCMQSVRSDVVTVCCGQAASMGAVLLAAGSKGKRFAWEHARIMIHQPLIHGQIWGPASDLEIQAQEMLRVRNELNRILSKHTGQTLEKIEKDTNRDKYLAAGEAKEYGLVDEVKNIGTTAD